eukprot:15066827-Heterocapsa_arctica.AAC.1
MMFVFSLPNGSSKMTSNLSTRLATLEYSSSTAPAGSMLLADSLKLSTWMDNPELGKASR